MCSIVASSNIVHDEINTVWKEIKTFKKDMIKLLSVEASMFRGMNNFF